MANVFGQRLPNGWAGANAAEAGYTDGARNLGLSELVFQSKKLAQAVEDPSSYFRAKTEALEALETAAKNLTRQQIEFFLQLGLPRAKAEESAARMVQAQMAPQLALHNQIWPSAITDLAVGDTFRRNNVVGPQIHNLPGAGAAPHRRRASKKK